MSPDGLHEAVCEQLAGQRDVLLVGVLGPDPMPDGRPLGKARHELSELHRRRAIARGDRSAPPRDVQRHLVPPVRLPAQWAVCLQTAFTKRFANNWQANATYSLSGSWDLIPCPMEGLSGRRVTNCPNYIGGERSLAVTDQRHRATFNGIWSLPYGFQLSGLYFY